MLSKNEVSVTNPEKWVDDYGDLLFQFAMMRVGNNFQLAEDLVQETFLSALKTESKHQGKSSERTWLTAILRNKIIDHYRRSNRNTFKQIDIHGEEFIEKGPDKGTWNLELAPSDWGDNPEKTFEQEEFASIFKNCLGELPQNLNTVFCLRELDGLDTQEICKDLGLSASNVWVILHRARTLLRRCLELRWLGFSK